MAVCGGGLAGAKHGAGGPDAGGGACMGTTPAWALGLENCPELERQGVDGINDNDVVVNWVISPELETGDGVIELERTNDGMTYIEGGRESLEGWC